MYYFREGDNWSAGSWEPTNAHTLDGAKRAASRKQMFQGTTLYVGERLGPGEPFPVAKKEADPINMNRTGNWVPVEN